MQTFQRRYKIIYTYIFQALLAEGVQFGFLLLEDLHVLQ